MSSEIKSVGVVGFGVAPYLIGALINSSLSAFGIKLNVVEATSTGAPPITTFGPEFVAVCKLLKISPEYLIEAASGVPIFGVEYEAYDRTWKVPYGEFGVRAGDHGFIGSMLRGISEDSDLKIEDYSLTALLMNEQFARLNYDSLSRDSLVRFGAQLDSKKLKDILKSRLELDGVKCFANVMPEDVVAKDGAKLFLENDTLDQDFLIKLLPDSSVKNIECEFGSILSVVEPIRHNVKMRSSIKKYDWGWVRESNTLNYRVLDAYFCPSKRSSSEVKDALVADYAAAGESVLENVRSACLSAPWRGRGLHLAGGELEAALLGMGSFSLAQSGVVTFLDLFPSKGLEYEAKHFNLQWKSYVQETSDFLGLLLGAENFLIDSQHRDYKVGGGLSDKLNLFLRRGVLIDSESDSVSNIQWLGMVCGVGARPRAADVRIETADLRRITKGLEQVKSLLNKKLANIINC